MDTFSRKFREWMDGRRMKAVEVADALFVTEQSVRNWRSAGIPPRRQAQVAEWMAIQDTLSHGTPIDFLRTRPLVVDVTPEEWHCWEDAAFAARKKLTDWARDGLNEMAEQRGFSESPNPVPYPALRAAKPKGPEYRKKDKSPE